MSVNRVANVVHEAAFNDGLNRHASNMYLCIELI